MNEQITEGNI